MQFSQWKFSVLLVSMFVLLGIRVASEQLGWGRFPVQAGTVVLVVAMLHALNTGKHARILGLVMAAPIMALTVWTRIEPPGTEHITFILVRACMTVFMGFATIAIMQNLLVQRKITHDTLVGAFCGYLLIGAMWTELYCLVDLVSPMSFRTSVEIPEDEQVRRSPYDVRWIRMQYFSYVTLSTLGYGDVLAVTPLTRLLACLEAICGQFYLAVLVSGLVSIRISQTTGHSPDSSEKSSSA